MAAATSDMPYDEDLVQDLKFLSGYSGKLSEIVAPGNNPPAGSDFSAITKHGAEKLAIPEGDYSRLVGILSHLARMQTRLREQGTQAIDLCTQQIEAYAKVHNDEKALEQWTLAKDCVEAALKVIEPDHPFSIMKKAERLYYSQQGILGEARIITDLRPVFDRAGEKILRMMVTHSLMLEYYEGGSQKRLELGVDLNDVGVLQRACERAQVKAVTLREAMKEQPWTTTLGLDSPEADRGDTE